MNQQFTIQKKSGISAIVYYVLLFIFLFLVCLNAPYIGDDFDFADLALTNPGDLLSYVLYYGNGRLLGNITGVFLINFPFLCATFKAATFCGIIYLLPRVITHQTKHRMLMVALVSTLVLGANPTIMGQVYIWTSAWANFTPPILIGLLCFYLIQSRKRFSFGWASIITVLGFCGQLYVEHATAIQILFSLCLLLYYHKQGSKAQLLYTSCWLIAGICGAVVMFALPKIFFLEVNRATGYRAFHIKNFATHAVGASQFILSTFEQCTTLMSVFSVCGFLVNKGKSLKVILKKALYVLIPVFLFIYPYLHNPSNILAVLRHILALVYLFVILIDILLMKDRRKKLVILSLFALALITLAPFLVITPFGERCMYLSYILLCISGLMFMEYCMDAEAAASAKVLQFAYHAATAVICVILAASMVKLHHYDKIRDSYIREQITKGNSTVVVFELPTKYAFNTYLLDFYYYNKNRMDVAFEIIPLDEWMQTYYEGS